MINKDDITPFIEIGAILEEDRVNVLKEFPGISHLSHLNRTTYREWDPCIENLDQEQLLNLVRGLTYVEAELKWSGGSVSAVIWCFRMFASKFPELADDLAEWIVRHNSNSYLPYGSIGSNCSVREKIELKEIQKVNLKLEADLASKLGMGKLQFEQFKQGIFRHQLNLLEESANTERLASIKREEEWSKKYEARKDFKAKKASLRKEILIKGENSSPTERLKIIIEYPQMPLEFFPHEWASASPEEIQNLDPEILSALLIRAKRRKKGVWKGFCQRMEKKHD